MRLKTTTLRLTCVIAILAAIAIVQPYVSGAAFRLTLALVFQWLILALLAVAGGRCAARWLGELGYRKSDLRRIVLFLVAAVCAGCAFIVLFFRQEEDIKVYDSAVYWIRVLEDRLIIAESIPGYLLHLRDTFAREYNHLAVFPLLPLSYPLGTHFTGYCLSVFLVYYLPACLLLTILALRVRAAAQRANPGVAAFVVCFGVCALAPALFWPVMNGYLDVAGVLVMAVLLNYALRWDGVDFSVRRNIVLAVVSVLLLLTRRWYGFYIVGFYFSVGVVAVVAMLAGRRFSAASLGRLLANMFMIAAVSCLFMLAINPALFTLFLGGNYALAYSAYKSMDLPANLWALARNIGLLWVAAAGVGVVTLLGHPATRWPCLRLLLAACVAAVLFCSVQDMGYHHHYMVAPTILLFAGVPGAGAANFAIRKKAPVLVVLLLAACLMNFALAFAPGLRTAAGRFEPVTTALRNYPKRNPDYQAVRRLVTDLTGKIGNASKYVYVVGDGASLSSEVLKRSHLPEVIDAAPYVLVSSIVDLRDGFPSQMFLAEYVLTSDTLRTEFATPQMVSAEAHDMLLHDPAAAAHYTVDSTYPTTEGELLLYRKTRPADAPLVDRLRERLRERYPDRPLVYEPNYFIALFQPDDGVGYSYNQWDDNAFTFDKKGRVPVIFRLAGTAAFSSLSFDLGCWAPGLELIVENQNGIIFRSPIAQAQRQGYRVDVTGSERLTVGIIEAQPGASVNAAVVLYRPELR